VRFDPGPEYVTVGLSRQVDLTPLGSRWEPEELYAPALVLRTGQSARIDEADLDVTADSPARKIREVFGCLSQLASPIVVGGGLWGALSINTQKPLPDGAEGRLEKFTELLALAIGNVESRQTLTELAHEQASLRRMAALLAGGVALQTVVSVACEEVGTLLDADAVALLVPADGAVSLVAGWSRSRPIPEAGTPWPLAPGNVAARVIETGRPVRTGIGVDDDSTVGAPVIVGGGYGGHCWCRAGARPPGPSTPRTGSRRSPT
jgi:hypothetical protein